MRVKYASILIFICFQTFLFAQTLTPLMQGGRCLSCPTANTAPPSNNSKNGNNGIFNGNEAIATSYTATACGLNYITASFNLNQRNITSGTPAVGVGAAQPAPFSVSGIPVCGKILKAFLYSSCEATNPPPSINASITNPFLANSIFPMSIIGTGASKCWSYDNSYTYRADITPIISGNGTYFLSGLPVFPSGTDVNGATLFIIYTDEQVNYTGSIVIADGMKTGLGSAVGETIGGFNVCGPTLLTTNFLIADDIQRFNVCNFSLNNAVSNFALPAASQFPWMLISQPGTPAISGQSSAYYEIDGSAGSDCVGLIAAGMYYRTNCLTCPNPMTLTASSASCTPNFTAGVSAVGGVAPLTYTWQGTAQTTASVTALSPGTHTVRVADANSCKSGTTSVFIASTVTVAASSASCTPNFTASALASGGNAPYTYSWSPSALTTSLVSGLTPGNYTVTVKDAANCQTKTATVSVASTLSLAASSASCVPNFTATAFATGGNAPYTYTWSGSAATTSLASALSVGPHTVTVRDAAACQTRTTVVNIAGTLSLAVSSASCVPNFTASALVTGGSAPYTYTWSGSAATTSLASALTPGPHTVTVADAGSCQTKTAVVNIAFTLSLTPASASCVPTGTASVLATGGTAPYTYAWTGSAQTTSLVTGLAAGPYTVTVSDASACQTGTASVTITRPSTLTVANSSVCIGYNGTLTAVGSTTSWTWTPAASVVNQNTQSGVVFPLVTTVYTVVNTNSLNCISTNTAQMVVLPTQTVPIANPTTCVGQNLNLLANVTYTGSTYNWVGPGSYTSNAMNPTIPTASVANNGNYTLTVISIPGCTSSAVAGVTVFSLPSPTITSNVSVCTNTALTLNASGAVTYTWQGPAPNNFYSTSTNTSVVATTTLDSGIYTLTASFANGCSASTTRSLTVRPLPATSFTANLGNPVCLGTTLTFTSTGGTSYQWRGPNGFINFTQNPSIANVTALASGVYTLIASLNSCTASAMKSVIVNPLPVPTATNDTPICALHPVQFTATGGVTYTWSGPATFSSNLANAAIASSSLANNGQHTVTVTDINGCKASAFTTVTVLPNPGISITGTNVCLNAPGTVTLTGGVSWAWTGPAAFSAFSQNANVATVNNITAGSYSVVATAANNCTTGASTTLSFVPLPLIVSTSTVACLNAVAVLSASGAATYTWTGPSAYYSTNQNAVIPVANASSIGTYTILGRGVNSCTSIGVAMLGTRALPAVVTKSNNIVCFREQAILTSTGTPANVTYTWSGPFGYSSNSQNAFIPSAVSVVPQVFTVTVTHPNTCTMSAISTLSTHPLPLVIATSTIICKNEPFTIVAGNAINYIWYGTGGIRNGPTYTIASVDANTVGNYTVIGTDANTCSNTAVAKIDTLSLPVIIASGSTVCIGKPAALNASGAAAYSWSGPGGFTSTSPSPVVPVTTSSFTQLYSVVGVAPNTCTQIAYVTVDTHPLPQPTFTAPSRVCFKSSMNLNGSGAKTYTWTGPYAYYSPNQNVTIPIFSNFQQGTYTLSVIDSLGCFNFTTTNIKIDPLPTGNLTSDNITNYCAPFCSKFKLNSTGTSSIINTSWIANNRTFSGATFSLCVAKATDNIIIGTFTDVIGCVNTVSFAVQAHQSPIADFVYTPELPVENADLVLFDDNSQGEKLVKWDWFFINNKGYLSSSKRTSYLFDNAGQFPVAMIVTNTWGCADTVIKTIFVESDFKLFVPNSFTPNGDGVNDVFMPKGRGLEKYKMGIYDRWGRLVFESHSFEVGWDGQVYDSNSSDDVFIWKINAVDVNGKVREMSGHVIIAR